MDIHLPDGLNQYSPTVFLIHGGGFIAGTKEDFEKQALLFCKKGFVTVNISHQLIDSRGLMSFPPTRLRSGVTIQKQVNDIQLAVLKFRQEASSLQIQSENRFMAGHSAGGVLSMLYVQGEWNRDGHILASGNWAGLTHLTLPPEPLMKRMDERWKEILYRATGAEPTVENLRLYDAVNPYAVTWQMGGKPHISVVPENNLIFGLPMEQELQLAYTQEYHRLLQMRSVPEKLVVIPQENHGFRIDPRSWVRVVDETAAFFRSLID